MSRPITPAMRAALLVAARQDRGVRVADRLWQVGNHDAGGHAPIGKPVSAPALLACERRGLLVRELGGWAGPGRYHPDAYCITPEGFDALRAEVIL